MLFMCCLILVFGVLEHGCLIQKDVQQDCMLNALIDGPRYLTWSRCMAKHIQVFDVQKDAQQIACRTH